MTIKNKLRFTYNGIESDDLGVANVNVDTGMNEEMFLADNSINEAYIKGRTKPYFMNKSYTPLMFNLSFAFLEPWNEELIQEVARTFHVDYYKPMWFDDDDDIIYYCMNTDSSQLIHNGLQEGYVNLQFKCNDICAYSRYKEVTHTDLTSELKFSNRGDLVVYPEFVFTKAGDGDITITNNTNNQILTMTNLLDAEEIYIDNENEVIESNTQLYRYNNHNNVFMYMNVGINKFEITGNLSNFKIRWRFKTLLN